MVLVSARPEHGGSPEAPVGEILRQYSLHLDDLRQIERTIESAALAALK